VASVNFAVPKLVLEGLKSAAKVLGEAGKIPLQQTVIDAQQQMVELVAKVYELNQQLQEANAELQRVRADQSSAEGRKVWENLLWIPNDDDPYCVHCWDAQKRLFHVGKTRIPDVSSSVMRCHECGAHTVPCPQLSYWQWTEAGGNS
jgi:hypothetical protein